MNKNIIRFTKYATEPNIQLDMSRMETEGLYGWNKSIEDPEVIIRSFSQLKVKEGYKLVGYQFVEGGNGNGIVWALPSGAHFPSPNECDTLDYFLSPPKPVSALDDYMIAVDGDRSPLSYLQAAVAYHELREFGAMWHGISWGRDEICPHIDDEEDDEFEDPFYEWTMLEEEPEIIEPHFYYNYEGHPVIVFHTINDIGEITWNRYTHVFSKEDYTLDEQVTCIGSAGMGIMF